MTDKEYEQIARYLDGETDFQLDDTLLAQADALKSLEFELKNLPIEEIPEVVDQQIAKQIIELSNSNNSVVKRTNDQLFKIVLSAAAVVITLVIVYWSLAPDNSQTKIHGTPYVITQVADLYHKALTNEEINWLRALILHESNPNTKILALDILNENSIPMDESLFAKILDEINPTVQLAFLGSIKTDGRNGQLESNISTLQKFQERTDLENLVFQKTNELINLLTK